jgi:hypothetical protein
MLNPLTLIILNWILKPLYTLYVCL